MLKNAFCANGAFNFRYRALDINVQIYLNELCELDVTSTEYNEKKIFVYLHFFHTIIFLNKTQN